MEFPESTIQVRDATFGSEPETWRLDWGEKGSSWEKKKCYWVENRIKSVTANGNAKKITIHDQRIRMNEGREKNRIELGEKL